MSRPPLTGVRVAELGERTGASACCSLLAQLGAEVVLVEPANSRTSNKWRNRAMTAAGKLSVPAGALTDTLLSAADVIVTSSDIEASPQFSRRHHQIHCDITAFGGSGPLSGMPYSDAMVQAVSGILDTTGHPGQPPTPVGFPVLEYCAGLYAAAAIAVALRVRRLHGLGQDIEIALFDCAISTLSTFLPFHMIGKPVSRAGNRHSLAAPWNAYRASDGWILICTATDDQWQKLCTAMGKPELANQEGYARNADRIPKSTEVDALVQQWVATLSVTRCVEALSQINIPCGPIATVELLSSEPNLLHRRMIHHLDDPQSGRKLVIPGSPLKASATPGIPPARIPRAGEDEETVKRRWSDGPGQAAPVCTGLALPMPLAGMKVIEIGQFTTAPLVARQMGALGAEVIKIEPPSGDGSRTWPPTQGDQGYFFTFSNSDKRSLMLDLRDARDRAQFDRLLQQADVLVENLKPGSLARLGYSPDELATRFPRLVYCGISGFGDDSAYPERPAFDTVVQAMSGFMDLTRANGTPTKAGISAADVVGGEFGLFSILAALEARDRDGKGQHIDISMQDVAAWVTQSAWNGASPAPPVTVVQCGDGYVLVNADRKLVEEMGSLSLLSGDQGRLAALCSREVLVANFGAAGFSAVAILTVSESVTTAHAEARQVLVQGKDASGNNWPLLNSPLRLNGTPPRVTRAIGKLGEIRTGWADRP